MSVVKKAWNNIEEFLCSISLVLMLVILTYQIILRFFFSSANNWSEELSRYALLWLIFISTSLAAKRDEHIRIEFCLKIWPKKMRKYIIYFGEIIWMVFSFALAYKGIFFTLDALRQMQIGYGVNLRIGWIYMAIPIGYGLMGIRLFVRIYTRIKSERRIEVNKAGQ